MNAVKKPELDDIPVLAPECFICGREIHKGTEDAECFQKKGWCSLCNELYGEEDCDVNVIQEEDKIIV